MGVTSNWCHPQGHHARRPPTTVPCCHTRCLQKPSPVTGTEQQEAGVQSPAHTVKTSTPKEASGPVVGLTTDMSGTSPIEMASKLEHSYSVQSRPIKVANLALTLVTSSNCSVISDDSGDQPKAGDATKEDIENDNGNSCVTDGRWWWHWDRVTYHQRHIPTH